MKGPSPIGGLGFGVRERQRERREVEFYSSYCLQCISPLPLHCRRRSLCSLSVIVSISLLVQAMTPEYKAYQEQVLSNCSKFAQAWPKDMIIVVATSSHVINYLLVILVKF